MVVLNLKSLFKKLEKGSALNVKPSEQDEKKGEIVAEIDIPLIGKARARREKIVGFQGQEATAPVWEIDYFEEDK